MKCFRKFILRIPPLPTTLACKLCVLLVHKQSSPDFAWDSATALWSNSSSCPGCWVHSEPLSQGEFPPPMPGLRRPYWKQVQRQGNKSQSSLLFKTSLVPEHPLGWAEKPQVLRVPQGNWRQHHYWEASFNQSIKGFQKENELGFCFQSCTT